MIGKQHEYDAMAKCEKELWWYKCLHEITLKQIEKSFSKDAKILDAGCGTGGMLSFLLNKGYSNLAGFDLSSDAIEYTKEKTSLDVKLISILDCAKHYPENSFDVVICNDIVVLLDEKAAKMAIGNLVSILKPKGILLMNFAAGKYFRGTHDLACEVLKRYNKQDVRELFKGTPAQAVNLRYWPFLLSPLIFLLRLSQRIQLALSKRRDYKSDVQLPPRILNNTFYAVTRFENNNLNLKPWGSSLFATIIKEYR